MVNNLVVIFSKYSAALHQFFLRKAKNDMIYIVSISLIIGFTIIAFNLLYEIHKTYFYYNFVISYHLVNIF